MTEQEIQLKADEFTAAITAIYEAIGRGAVPTPELRSAVLGISIDIHLSSGIYAEAMMCDGKLKLIATPKLKALAAEIVALAPEPLAPAPPNPPPEKPQQ